MVHTAEILNINFEFPQYDIPESNKERVLWRWKHAMPQFIWNTAALEGNTFTYPEVVTLLDGITVGGHSIDEENQIKSLQRSCQKLVTLIEEDTFRPIKKISDTLHQLIAQYEAIESEHFRGEGSALGGGNMQTSLGTIIPGTTSDKLIGIFQELSIILERENDPIKQALIYFIIAVRHQFYFDGNKRTARLMMNGILLSHNYEAVTIPYARKLEFNNALDILFIHNDATELAYFLISCLERMAL